MLYSNVLSPFGVIFIPAQSVNLMYSQSMPTSATVSVHSDLEYSIVLFEGSAPGRYSDKIPVSVLNKSDRLTLEHR